MSNSQPMSSDEAAELEELRHGDGTENGKHTDAQRNADVPVPNLRAIHNLGALRRSGPRRHPDLRQG